MNYLAIIIAYIFTGLFYVGRDFLEPAYNRPGYIRERQVYIMALMILLWLPWTFRVVWGYWHHTGWHGVRKYFFKDLLLLYLVFIVAASASIALID